MSSENSGTLLSPMSYEKKCSFLEGVILSSPPGEIKEVYNDLRAIIRNDKNLVKRLEKIFKKYNFDNLIVVSNFTLKAPYVLSKYASLPNDRIHDPRSKKAFKFDHFSKKASNFVDYIHNRKLECLRTEFEEKIDRYVLEKYPYGAVSIYSVDDAIQILISSSRFTPNKFINGSWCSEWVYNPSNFTLEGELKVKVHHFENGNVQLKVTDKFSEIIPLSKRSPQNVVQEVLQIIADSEDKFHVKSKLKFDHVNDRIFKNLRKVLPITKTTMNWDAIEGYNIIGVFNGV